MMNFKEWFYERVPANITLFYDEKEVFSYHFLSESQRSTPLFDVRGVRFFIRLSSDKDDNTTITLYSKSDDSEIDYQLFDMEIEVVDEEDTSQDTQLIMPLYAPALPYTKTTSAVLFDLPKLLKDETQFAPILIVTTEDRLAAYTEDAGIRKYAHFLNLCLMQYMTNRGQREQSKKKRKEEKALGLTAEEQIAKPELEDIGAPEIYDSYKEAAIDRKLVTPVFCWNVEDGTLSNLKLFLSAVNDFKGIAISITSFSTFEDSMSDIYDLVKEKGARFILDYGAKCNIEDMQVFVKRLSKKFPASTIVYLGASFTTGELSISRDDAGQNLICQDKAFNVYKALCENAPQLGYGDYCGYDQYTISEYVGGTIPAKIVLHSLTGKDNMILIRREFDRRDVKSNDDGRRPTVGYRYSMLKLLRAIKNNAIPVKFLNESLCNADQGFKGYANKDKATTPGIIKTLCFRHNIIAVMRMNMNIKS